MARFRMYIKLDRLPTTGWGDAKGPAFAGWLPDGRSDAIHCTSSSNVPVSMWFERKQRLDGGFYVYDWHDSHPINEDDIKDQIALDAGILIIEAELEIHECEVLNLIKQDEDPICTTSSERPDAVARIAFDVFYESVKVMVERFRLEFGCYWLDAMPQLDSYKEQRQWLYINELAFLSSQSKWTRIYTHSAFENFTIEVPSGVPDYWQQFILRSDWFKMQQNIQLPLFARSAREMLIQARLRYESRDYMASAIMACTSLEILVNEKIRHISQEKWAMPQINKMQDALGVLAKIMFLKSDLQITAKDLDLLRRLISVRHELIHRGVFGQSDDMGVLVGQSLLVIASFFRDPTMKFPSQFCKLCRHREFDGRKL